MLRTWIRNSILLTIIITANPIQAAPDLGDVRKLLNFVNRYSLRVDCESEVAVPGPTRDRVSLVYFDVSMKGNPSADDFRSLVAPLMIYFPMDYLALGGLLGDQGWALQVMGLGHLLGVWELITPYSLSATLDIALAKEMAGAGFIRIERKGAANEVPGS